MSTIATAPITTTAIWHIDPVHSVVEFKVKHMMISHVKGQFTGVFGVLSLDETDVTKSRVEVTVDASTINTRDPGRDKHLRSAEFLDVETYPTLAFQSTSVQGKGSKEKIVTGDLTIHGVTREIAFAVEGLTPPSKDPWGNTRLGLSATAKISRKEFGLTWNAALESGGLLVGDEVIITLDVQFVKQ